MIFDRKALIAFYDSPSSWVDEVSRKGAHVSAITGLIGEDVVLGLLLHYLEKEGEPSRLVTYKCKGQGLRGRRLDAWIEAGETINQVEVKNWSAHSLGGYDLPIDASADHLLKFAENRWNRYFGSMKLPKGLAKVMTPMTPPSEFRGHRHGKILALWSYVINSHGKPMSRHMDEQSELLVFSASAYLRSLNDEMVELHVPRVEARVRLLRSLIVNFDEGARVKVDHT